MTGERPGEPAGQDAWDELDLPLLPGFREMALRRMAAERRRLVSELTAQRQSAGLSQTQVAARMGTSQSAVARIESGGADVRASTLERYAAAIGSQLSWQLTGTRPTQSPPVPSRPVQSPSAPPVPRRPQAAPPGSPGEPAGYPRTQPGHPGIPPRLAPAAAAGPAASPPRLDPMASARPPGGSAWLNQAPSAGPAATSAAPGPAEPSRPPDPPPADGGPPPQSPRAGFRIRPSRDQRP